MPNYYQPEIECASREQIRAWQDERLVETVEHAYKNVEFYRRKMDEKGIKPSDIKSVDDLCKLPFLTKAACAKGGREKKTSGAGRVKGEAV